MDEEIPLDHYEKYYILGLTSKSYVVGHCPNDNFEMGIKVNKRTMKARTDNNKKIFYPESEIENIILLEQRNKIAKLINQCKDIDKLKKIKAIING